MKHLLWPALSLLGFVALICSANTNALDQHSTGTGPSFKGPVGLQLYSLRDQFAKDVSATLDQVRSFGIEYVELAGTYNLAPEKFKAMLDAKGLKPVSGHFSFEQFRDKVEDVARDAKTLGIAICRLRLDSA